jgi:hypothetical protein
MKLIFSKNAFIIAGITYLIIIAAYVIGVLLPTGNGFLALSRKNTAIMLTVLVSPFVVGISILSIIVCLKSKYVVIGYLILTIGVSGIAGGTIFAISKLINNSHNRQAAEKIKLQNDYVDDTIAAIIKNIYPNAQFNVDQFGVEVILNGYKYQNLPDSDNEISKWKNIKQSFNFDDYPYSIRVDYYFENTNDRFASLHLSDFSYNYYCTGMSKEGLEYLTPILHRFLSNHYDDFSIESGYSFNVKINKKLHSNDEPAEAVSWQEFVSTNGINTELVEIIVAYSQSENPPDIRYYEVRQDYWY